MELMSRLCFLIAKIIGVLFFFFFQTVSRYGLECVLSFQQSIFNFICLSLSGYGFVYMSAVATEARRGLDPLELKL